MWDIPWVLLKSANFATSRNTNKDWILIIIFNSFDFSWVFNNCLVNMVTILIMSAKMVTPDLLKRKVFKFNNLGLTPGTNLKFYTSVAKGFKLKVRKLLGLNPIFVEVTGENLVGGTFPPPPSWIGLISLILYYSVSLKKIIVWLKRVI